jgi:hypothetical protein
MVVLDAVGISFADFLQYLMDTQLQTSYDGMIFMLQTIFVGHRDDGTTETVHTETIPMHLLRIEINLDFAKGAYTMEFMPNMNFDVKKYQRFMTIGQATNAYAKGATIGELVESFQANLNKRASDFYDQLSAIVNKTSENRTKKQLGRKVQYQISIPKEWKNWQTMGKNVAGTSETALKSADPKATPNISVKVNDANFSSKPGSLITEHLNEMFKTVNEIAALGNFKQSDPSKDGSVTFYKYIVGITSNNDTFMVHVDVVLFEVPNAFRRKPGSTEITDTDLQTHHPVTIDGVTRRIPNDYIVYDYIFSGQNKDILSLELKVQEFQMLLASNLRIGTLDMQKAAPDGTIDPEQQKLVEELMNTRPYDPIMIPQDTDEALKAFSTLYKVASDKQIEEQKKRQNYTRNLSMFYAGSPITALMTIKGNPEVMHKFNIGKILDHPSSPTETGYRAQLEAQILRQNPNLQSNDNGGFKVKNFSPKSYAVAPVFVRVNIYGPPLDEAWAQTRSSLSDVYYVVFKLTNIIQNGVFTQEFELYSHNVFGPSNLGATSK